MDDIYNVTVSPIVPDSIDSAFASYEFKEGILSVSWEKKDGILYLSVNVPACAHGSIVAGNEKIPLRQGENKVSPKLK